MLALEAARAAAEPGVAVTARALSKGFGATSVLKRLDFHAPAGQFLAIVGRSGCGKSTLLRLIAGLDHPDSGEVSVDDSARVMFQEPRLLPWARVLANVEIGLGTKGAHPQARARALAALEAVGLSDRADDWPSVLSGGQKQRVALARALVSSPRLLLLDEPLGALDALTRIEMQRLLEQVWLRDRFTALLVTHDVAEAITLADRIVLIEQGGVAMETIVDFPRPRRRDDPHFGALESRILDRLLDLA